MKINNKITLVLVTALVMTVAMVVVAYAEILYLPQYSYESNRFTQVYELNTSYNWKYTINISNLYGTEDIEAYAIHKNHENRGWAVQCTSNGLTAFPTYYKVARCNDYVHVTPEVSITGNGADVGSYSRNAMGSYLCLAVRNDPRYTYTVTNVGNWSPDSYN